MSQRRERGERSEVLTLADELTEVAIVFASVAWRAQGSLPVSGGNAVIAIEALHLRQREGRRVDAVLDAGEHALPAHYSLRGRLSCTRCRETSLEAALKGALLETETAKE
jgi:hypothetical protein